MTYGNISFHFVSCGQIGALTLCSNRSDFADGYLGFGWGIPRGHSFPNLPLVRALPAAYSVEYHLSEKCKAISAKLNRKAKITQTSRLPFNVRILAPKILASS